ncbi:MAG: hypothetical protein KDB22_27720, partial [Planctomycetales bacterium]|nr:hypothetical protein [Planctomycetales bacterium]
MKPLFKSSRRRQFRRLFAEQLEDRRVLATVVWDGGGGDFFWSNPLNWSGDQLPQNGDDVTINSGENTIEFNSPVDLDIDTLTLQTSIKVTQGRLGIGGDFAIDSGRSISVEGANSQFVATNATSIDGISIFVSAGGIASFPSVIDYDANYASPTLRASGAGSVIDLSNLTNLDFSGAHAHIIPVEALVGGTIDLSSVTQLSDRSESYARGLAIKADGAGSKVDLSSLVNFLQESNWDTGWRSSLTTSNGGEIDALALTTLKKVNASFDGNGTLPHAQ